MLLSCNQNKIISNKLGLLVNTCPLNPSETQDWSLTSYSQQFFLNILLITQLSFQCRNQILCHTVISKLKKKTTTIGFYYILMSLISLLYFSRNPSSSGTLSLKRKKKRRCLKYVLLQPRMLYTVLKTRNRTTKEKFLLNYP